MAIPSDSNGVALTLLELELAAMKRGGTKVPTQKTSMACKHGIVLLYVPSTCHPSVLLIEWMKPGQRDLKGGNLIGHVAKGDLINFKKPKFDIFDALATRARLSGA